MNRRPYGSGVDGGRIAARGLRYQYLRTLEAMLDLIDKPHVSSVRVEGPPSYEHHIDAVDFDVLDRDGHCCLAVQVKSKDPGRSVSGAETFAILAHLISAHDASSYQLLTNGVPTSSARELADALSAGVELTELRERLVQLLALAPRRLAELRAMTPQMIQRLARCRVLFDGRDDVEILESLHEALRAYRNRARTGLGQRSAGMLTGYLVSEVLRRAADGSDAVFTIEELRLHLLVDSEDLARVGGMRDWGVVIGPMPSVPDVARPALLRQLVSTLNPSRPNGIRRTALVGLSGVGKSSLAASYVADRADFYDWIFWVDGETADSLLSSFRRIARFLHLTEAAGTSQASATQIRDDVHGGLGQTPGRWAIIFDNVSQPREIEPWIPPAGRGDIIITSIDSVVRQGAAKVINVGIMEQPEAVELLRRRLRLSESDCHRHRRELHRLADGLSYWPLALELASGYMDTCGISIDDVDYYLERLKVRSLADADSLPPNYPRTLTAALWLCLERLQRRIVEYAQDYRPQLALGIVTYAAFLASRQLPIHLLAAAVFAPDSGPEVGQNPVYADPSDFNLGEVIRELRRFSLVIFDQDLPSSVESILIDENRTITTNSIVQDLLRVSAENEGNISALDRLADHVVRWLSWAHETNQLERALVLFSHASTLAGHLRRYDVRGEHVPLLYGNLAGAYRIRAEPRKAEEFLRAELDFINEAANPNQLLAIQTKLMLVDILFDAPGSTSISFSEATAYLEDILQYSFDISDESPSAAVRFVADVKALLSRPIVAAAGDPRFVVIQRRCEDLAAHLDPTPYSQMMDAIHEANALIEQGKLAEAERLCNKALRSDSLGGVMELEAKRILLDALVRQGKWRAANKTFDDFKQCIGSSGLYQQVTAQLVHNVGYYCGIIWIAGGDREASTLLGKVLDWPVTSADSMQQSSEWPARLRLLTAIRMLADGNYRDAESLARNVRPADLRSSKAEETRGWCMLWQMTNLAAFRIISRIYLSDGDW